MLLLIGGTLTFPTKHMDTDDGHGELNIIRLCLHVCI